MEHENAGSLALVANAAPPKLIVITDTDNALGVALTQLGSRSADSEVNDANSNIFARIIAVNYTELAAKGILEGLETVVHRRTVQAVLAKGKHPDKESAKRAQSCISMASKRLRESAAGRAYAWPPKPEKADKLTAIQTIKDWAARCSEDHAAALVFWVPVALGDARRTDVDHAKVLAARAALSDDVRRALGL